MTTTALNTLPTTLHIATVRSFERDARKRAADAYNVYRSGGVFLCDCPHYRYRLAGTGKACKHIAAVKVALDAPLHHAQRVVLVDGPVARFDLDLDHATPEQIEASRKAVVVALAATMAKRLALCEVPDPLASVEVNARFVGLDLD